MPKQRLWRSLVLIAASVFLLSACAPGAKEAPKPAAQKVEKITLRAADSLPLTHSFSLGFVQWMNRVTQLTDGQVVFQHFPAEQLGKRKDTLDLTRVGTADIGYVVPLDVPGQLPRSAVVELPGFTGQFACGSNVFYQLIQDITAEEYLPNGVRPVLAHYVTGFDLFTNKQVRVPADVKGLKIRSGGGIQELTVRDLGGIPVTLAPAEVYEAVQRKTIDGVLYPYAGVKPYKMQEVTKFATNGSALGASSLTYVINESVWKKMPANVQKAMTQASNEMVPKIGELADQSHAALVAELKAGGLTVADLTDAEKATWRAAIANVEAAWIESVGKQGLQGSALLKKRGELQAKICK